MSESVGLLPRPLGLSPDRVGVRRCSPREFQETVGVSETGIVIVMGRGPRLVPCTERCLLVAVPKIVAPANYELWGTGDARLFLQWAVFPLCMCIWRLDALVGN